MHASQTSVVNNPWPSEPGVENPVFSTSMKLTSAIATAAPASRSQCVLFWRACTRNSRSTIGRKVMARRTKQKFGKEKAEIGRRCALRSFPFPLSVFCFLRSSSRGSRCPADAALQIIDVVGRFVSHRKMPARARYLAKDFFKLGLAQRTQRQDRRRHLPEK